MGAQSTDMAPRVDGLKTWIFSSCAVNIPCTRAERPSLSLHSKYRAVIFDNLTPGQPQTRLSLAHSGGQVQAPWRRLRQKVKTLILAFIGPFPTVAQV